MKNSKYLCLSVVTLVLLGGCTDPKIKAINDLCVGLENISDQVERNAQYMQCRKACGDAEIYNMPDGEEKQTLIDICVGAGETGDNKLEKSPERNWLGVMP